MFKNKYRGLITNYEINTYTRAIFKFFVMSHRVIFAYETKLNILKREQVTKIL